MEVAERGDSRTVMERLIKIYGDKTPTSSLLQQFHCRQQRETETVREFSLALQEIVGRLKRRDPDAVAKPDEMLRDRFVLGLRDGDIRRAIKVDLRRKPDLKFEDVRSEALHLAADQGESAAVNVASVVPIPSPSIVKALQTTLEKTVQQQQEMSEMMAVMRLELAQLRLAPTTPTTQYRRPRRQPQWDDQGNPICLTCNQSGHMARDCPQRRPPQHSRNQNYHRSPPSQNQHQNPQNPTTHQLN